MASIADLCWTNSQDLFTDLNLDALYSRQIKSLGAERFRNYPYHLLVHTGKITIGISLASKSDMTRGQILFQGNDRGTRDNDIHVWHSWKEPVD